MKEAEEIGFHKKFKLESSLSTGNMVRKEANFGPKGNYQFCESAGAI